MSKEKIKELLPKADSILWSYSANKDGLHPVKIRILYNREYKYYPVQWENKNLFLNKAEGSHIIDTDKKKLKGRNREIKEKIDSLIFAAYSAIEKITSNGRQFNFERFERNFVSESISGGFFYWYGTYLSALRAEQRVGSYNSYNNALQALKKFRNDRELNPSEITPEFLKDFERYLLKGSKERSAVSQTTVGIYMRALKVIYNFIADEFPQLKEDYPFATKQNDKRRYKIGTTSSKKGDALSREDLIKFMEIQADGGTPEREAKLYWLFSYYCKGMNIRDIALLKYQNINKDDVVRYTRNKTKDTTKDARLIEFPLWDEAKEILLELGNPDRRSHCYVFPILEPGLDAFKMDAVIKQKTKTINKWLKRLCEANELPLITTYWARHTFATISKYSGKTGESIREDLGHGDLRTTEAYLRRFGLDRKKAEDDKIRAFMKKIG